MQPLINESSILKRKSVCNGYGVKMPMAVFLLYSMKPGAGGVAIRGPINRLKWISLLAMRKANCFLENVNGEMNW